MFIDRVKVTLRSGRGGNGCVSFRREKSVPKGGPDGGRGGDGGNIYIESDRNLNTLAYFRFHPINKAKKGEHGKGSHRQGKKGDDLVLRVPVGTIVKEEGKEKILFDFIEPGQKYLAVRGGKGGLGNASFATPTHQAPREFKEGRPGEEAELILELKLIADVGLVGFPNVGKSTLISRISSARPVIADYPFTTLTPNLGVVDGGEFDSLVVADIPGLIEGAHKGRGLGVQFLKHVERTKILVHIVDVSPVSERDPVEDYTNVMQELEKFNPSLARRKQILAANKIDLLGKDKSRLESLEGLARRLGLPFFAISALKRSGLKELVGVMFLMLKQKNKEPSNKND
ncbi:MAG: GTPase ObgE [Candidatus Aminicenantes bacterium]|nr:GTPase ObgE [Candidatus Aminicenantes bacterium]